MVGGQSWSLLDLKHPSLLWPVLRFLSCPDTSLLSGRSLLDVHVLQNCSLSCHSSEPVGEQCLMEHER